MHKSSANSTLYNIKMKGLPLWSHIFLFELHLFVSLWKLSSAISIYLPVSTNEPCIHSYISGVMWKVAPDSKFQLVSCDMSPIDAYTFYDSLWSVLFSNILFILVDPYTQVLCLSVFHWILVSGVSGFDFFLWNDTQIHIFSKYLVSDRYIYYDYY